MRLVGEARARSNSLEATLVFGVGRDAYQGCAALSDRWLGVCLDERLSCPAAAAPIPGERAA
jgi:hypothetical protein